MASKRQAGSAMFLTRYIKWSSFLLALFIVVIIGATLMATDISLIGDLLQDPEFGRAVLFSLQTSMIATMLAAITAVPAGLYLARRRTPATRFIDALFDISHCYAAFGCRGSPALFFQPGSCKSRVRFYLHHTKEPSLPSFL